jgi:hypothetical protein
MIRLSLAAGTVVLLFTELYGALGILSPLPVWLLWVSLLLVVMLALRTRESEVRWLAPSGDPVVRILRVLLAVLILGTLTAGILCAPNSWDSLTYHLPRVERWVEQGHLRFWPTSVDRQLWLSPWTEYAMLHLRLLSGGDRLAALPSWAAYLGCIAVSGAVVRQFGGTERQIVLGALVAATVPVAVLHASSTQTDLPTAFWVLCTAALVLDVLRRPEASEDLRPAAWIGLAAGLAVATKGTAWLALVPWLVLYAGALLRTGNWRRLVRSAMTVLVIVLLLNGAIFARNIELFGDPLGDTSARHLLRLTPMTPGAAIANLLANLSLHLGLPWEWWNLGVTQTLLGLQRSMLRVDPITVFPIFGGFRINPFSTHESVAGNPVHLLAALIVIGIMVLRKRRRPSGVMLGWVLAGLAAFLLHGMVIRWQPFGARLQLAALVWCAPVLALSVRERWSSLALSSVLFVAAMPALLTNHTRPLIPIMGRSILSESREDQYFAETPGLRRPIERALEDLRIAACTEVGLSTGYDAPEYLLRAAARIRGQRLALRYVSPASSSARVSEPRQGTQLCAIIVLTPPPGWRIPIEAKGMRVMWSEGPVGLLLRPVSGGSNIQRGIAEVIPADPGHPERELPTFSGFSPGAPPRASRPGV